MALTVLFLLFALLSSTVTVVWGLGLRCPLTPVTVPSSARASITGAGPGAGAGTPGPSSLFHTSAHSCSRAGIGTGTGTGAGAGTLPLSIKLKTAGSHRYSGTGYGLQSVQQSSEVDNDKPVKTIEGASLSPYALSTPQWIYVVLTSIFLTSLIIADVVGVKIFEIKLPFSVFGFNRIEHTCGMLTFPITFLLSDIITEYYGPDATKNTVWLGLAMSILVFFVVNVAQAMPYLDKAFNVTPEAFNMIFGSAKLLYVASLSAYLVGSWTNIWLFGAIKRLTNGKRLWVRSVFSTVISQLLDSFVVSFTAFRFGKIITNQVPATMREIFDISITGYGLKFVITALLTPVLYGLKYLMEDRFKLRPMPSTPSTAPQPSVAVRAD